MITIKLTLEERTYLDSIKTFDMGIIMSNTTVDLLTLEMSDNQICSMYDILLHENKTEGVSVLNKILKNTSNNLIKPLAINQI